MNWVDLAIILLLLFFALVGRGKSFIGELAYLVSFGVSFLVSINSYNFFASWLRNNFQMPHSLANVLGFILVWFISEAIIFPLIYLLIPKLRFLAGVDRLLNPLAFLPSLFRGLIFISILLILTGTFPIQPQIKQAVQSSKLGSYILLSTQQLESPLKNVFGGQEDDTLTFLTIKPKSDQKVELGFQTKNYKVDATAEQKMIELVNSERRIRGFNELEYDPKLAEVGREHSGDMFSRGYFSHYSPEGKTVADRAAAHKINYLVIGENLAFAPNLTLAHRGLMNSEGHRANILSQDYNKIGIGIMDGGIYGLMITQVFSN